MGNRSFTLLDQEFGEGLRETAMKATEAEVAQIGVAPRNMFEVYKLLRKHYMAAAKPSLSIDMAAYEILTLQVSPPGK
jgi:hypothetical protein